MPGRCISNAYRIVPYVDCRPRVPYYEYFIPRLTQIVLSATRREGNLTLYIGTSRLVYLAPLTFHASVFRPPPRRLEHAVTYRFHHLSPVRHLFIHSRLSPRPAHRASALSHPPRWPLLFFIHTCAHTFTVSFSLFRIAALSPRMSPLPGGARFVDRSSRNVERTIYSVICGFTHCCRNRAV